MLDEILVSLRLKQRWSINELGRQSRVSPNEIRAIESGRQIPRLSTLKALTIALEDSAGLLTAAALEDAGLAGTQWKRWDAPIDLVPLHSDDEQLDNAAYVVNTEVRQPLRVARAYSVGLLGKYGSASSAKEKRTYARALLTLAMSFDEEVANPPDFVFSMLDEALGLLPPAEAGFALWQKSKYRRKRADFLRSSNEYKRAESDAVALIETSTDPGMRYVRSLGYRELATIQLARQDNAAFEQAILAAELAIGPDGLETAAVLDEVHQSGELTNSDESPWPSHLPRLTRALVAEAKVRGMARLGLFPEESLTVAVNRAGRFSREFVSLSSMSLPYAYASAILSSPSADDVMRQRALTTWHNAYLTAQRGKYQRQFESGNRVIKDPMMRLPLVLRLDCQKPNCGRVTIHRYNAENSRYECEVCGNAALGLPYNRRPYRFAR